MSRAFLLPVAGLNKMERKHAVMAGYRGKIITKQFPDLSDGDDDPVWVTVRNPNTMAPEELRPKKVKLNQAGDGLAEDTDDAETMSAGNEVAAKLILGWRMWDATVPIKLDPATGLLVDDDETQPRLLPMRPTGADVAKAPMAVHVWLGEVLQAATPQTTTEHREAGTSSES